MKDLLDRILPLSKKASANQIIILHQKLAEMQDKLDRIEKTLYYQLDQEKYPALLKQWYKDKTGKILDLDDPKTFNEKIQWLKLNDRDPRKTVLSDKYLVREWIKEKIGEKYLIPTIGVWENAEDIDFSKLPDRFVLKCTHDSGGLVVCNDKSQLNYSKTKKWLNRRLKRNFYEYKKEWPYKNVKARIIAEEFMEGFNYYVKFRNK